MSENDIHVISVNILDRVYKVKCPPEQVQDLQEAARYIDEQMRRLQQSAKPYNVEQIAVVTALNSAHELMTIRKHKNNHINGMNQKIQDLHQRIQDFLAEEKEVAL